MIGMTITPSHIDYSKILNEDVADNLIMGECIIVSGQAKELVHRITGALCNSIMWKAGEDEGDFNKGGDTPAPESARVSNPPKHTGYVGSNLEYAGVVESGRRDMPNYPRNPYMRPAVDYTKNQRLARCKGILDTAIKEAYNHNPSGAK